MYPDSIYVALKVIPIWVLWAQSIYYLGTWTLRVNHLSALRTMTIPWSLTLTKKSKLLRTLENQRRPCVLACSLLGDRDE